MHGKSSTDILGSLWKFPLEIGAKQVEDRGEGQRKFPGSSFDISSLTLFLSLPLPHPAQAVVRNTAFVSEQLCLLRS